VTDALAVDLAGDDRPAPLTLVEQGQRVRPFDFFKKETVDRSHLRQLSGLFESMCHRLASAAGVEIRQSVRFETDISEIEPQTWEQYATTLPEVTFISSAVVLQLDGRIVIHANTNVALEFLDFYFGGEGENVPQRDELTDLEREVFSQVVEVMWEALPSAFGGLMEVSIGAIQHSNNALRLQSVRPNEMCLVIRFAVTVNDRPPLSLDMTIPLEVVEPIINKLEEQQLSEFGRSAGGSLGAFERLEMTPTDVRASYPPVMLAAEEILHLKPGQVITLKEGAEAPAVQLVVGDTVIATASVEHDDDPLICRILSLEVAAP
jgi:flagellar motor switch protein FliM